MSPTPALRKDTAPTQTDHLHHRRLTAVPCRDTSDTNQITPAIITEVIRTAAVASARPTLTVLHPTTPTPRAVPAPCLTLPARYCPHPTAATLTLLRQRPTCPVSSPAVPQLLMHPAAPVDLDPGQTLPTGQRPNPRCMAAVTEHRPTSPPATTPHRIGIRPRLQLPLDLTQLLLQKDLHREGIPPRPH